MQVSGNGRKGKLIIHHRSAFRHYLLSNGLADTHIHFHSRIEYPYIGVKKEDCLKKYEEALGKKNGGKEQIH